MVESRGFVESSRFRGGAGQVDQFDGQVRAGIEAACQELHTSPERSESLKFGVVEDVAEKLGHGGVDTRDQLGLTRVLPADMWGWRSSPGTHPRHRSERVGPEAWGSMGTTVEG